MSTVVVVKKDGQIAIGADTLSMYGSTKHYSDFIVNKTKIVKFTDNYIATIGHTSWNLIFKRGKPFEIYTFKQEIGKI
jgi:ATP-dependent HslUV protease, peptidase subunit HslV